MPELECCRGVNWIPTPEPDCSATLITLAPGYRQVVVVPDTVMCRKYVEWLTAWKAEYPHCSLLVYDIEIVPRENCLMTATIPIVERSIFDEGHPPVLQQIFPVADDSDSSRAFQGILDGVPHTSLAMALRHAQYARYSKSCLRRMSVIIERLAHFKE